MKVKEINYMTLASVATVKMEPCVEKNIVMVG